MIQKFWESKEGKCSPTGNVYAVQIYGAHLDPPLIIIGPFTLSTLKFWHQAQFHRDRTFHPLLDWIKEIYG